MHSSGHSKRHVFCLPEQLMSLWLFFMFILYPVYVATIESSSFILSDEISKQWLTINQSNKNTSIDAHPVVI